MFVGQEELKKHITELVETERFPQFIMVVGWAGSGRSMLVEYIANKINAQVTQPESLKVDDIRGIISGANKLSSEMIYYLKGADELTPQAENALLKLTEEPPKNCYVVLGVEDVENLLPTIQSRGKIFRMGTYTQNELKQFTDDDLMLGCVTNMGEIKVLEDVGVKELYDFTNKVIDNIGKVSTLNSLNIYKQIKLKDDDSGYPPGLFFNMVLYVCNAKMKDVPKDKAFRYVETMRLVYKYRGMFKIKGVNKLSLLDIFVLDLRKIWREN